MPSFQVERWADCWDEIELLWYVHACETGLTICPDNARYEDLEKRGALLLATMRVGAALVGIHRSVIGADLHCKGRTYAVSDGWFVLPEYRKGQAAVRLLRFTEAAARQRGVDYIYQASPSRRDIGPILKRQGYSLTDTLYRKDL